MNGYDGIGINQMMRTMICQAQDMIEFQKSLDEIFDSIPQEPTIEQLKKQIKYSKNPLEVKRLNMKLNQMYKERKRK